MHPDGSIARPRSSANGADWPQVVATNSPPISVVPPSAKTTVAPSSVAANEVISRASTGIPDRASRSVVSWSGWPPSVRIVSREAIRDTRSAIIAVCRAEPSTATCLPVNSWPWQ